jgi:DNA-directed RNA polymerase subunit D
MKIEIIKQDKDKISFLIKGISYNIANSLRRYADEIYVPAIDNLEIVKNDSSLFDEILGHRLGLIPLVTDKTFTPRDQCSCKGKGCVKCTANLLLKVEGPCTVYASDLKSKTIKPVYPDMPLVTLDKGQKVEIIAEIIAGQGKKHSKFSPGLVWYRAYPQIKIEKCENIECTEICPQKVFETEDKKIIVKNQIACDLCNACVEACKKLGGSINISPSNEDFIFNIESWGQMSVKDIFLSICDKLEEDLKGLAKEAGKID